MQFGERPTGGYLTFPSGSSNRVEGRALIKKAPIMIRLPECPICGKTVPPATDPNASYSPFCSRRCKEIDFFRWCDGRYAIVESIDLTQQQPESMTDDGEYDEGLD